MLLKGDIVLSKIEPLGETRKQKETGSEYFNL